MCSLMDDATLNDWLAHTIDPQAQPIDDALLLFFNIQFKSVAEGRGVPEPSLVQQIPRAQSMTQSPHGLVKALGLVALSWYAPSGIVGESTRTSFNRLAELCPEADSTQEVMDRLLLVTAGENPAQSQALKDLLNRSDWNASVQAVMAADPVVTLARQFTASGTTSTNDATTSTAASTDSVDSTASAGTAAESADDTSGLAPVLAAAQDHPEPEVKDWCLRLVHAQAQAATPAATALLESAQASTEPAAKAAAKPKSASAAAVTVQPLEALRARHIQFAQALAAKDLTAAEQHLDVLMNAHSAEEPIDSNTHLNALLDGVELGLRLVMAGDYAKAQAVYERIVQKYPNSDVAARSQEHINHIKAVLASQQK
jgi:hypothetical protein